MLVHFAAESHVDRSILGSAEFVQTNIVGTSVLLDATKEIGVNRFFQVSTDEVYGCSEMNILIEATPLHPNSPYSATKTTANMPALAYQHTFGLPVIVTRCSNNYGSMSFRKN